MLWTNEIVIRATTVVTVIVTAIVTTVVTVNSPGGGGFSKRFTTFKQIPHLYSTTKVRVQRPVGCPLFDILQKAPTTRGYNMSNNGRPLWSLLLVYATSIFPTLCNSVLIDECAPQWNRINL